MNSKSCTRRIIFGIGLLAGVITGRAEFPPYEVLGNFQEGSNFVHAATDILADSQVIVGGTLRLNTEISEAWRWKAGGGVAILNFPATVSAGAEKVAADGSAIGGSYTVFTNFPASQFPFRWTTTNGIQNILQGLIQANGVVFQSSGCEGISSDGKVIAGNVFYSTFGINRPRAFRWSETTGFRLLFGPQTSDAGVMALSGDGSTIIGYTREQLQPCR